MLDMAEERLARARCALDGLSVGDAFGELFFGHPRWVAQAIGARKAPAAPWYYTDDTQMALSLVETLWQHGQIEQAVLARSFGARYDPARGYGAAMHDLLPRLRGGEAWQTLAPALFGGQGSFGNGAAMRIAPLGAYFADDLDLLVEQAERSAVVTHAHPEASAGAIAVAVAAALAWRGRNDPAPSVRDFLDAVAGWVPESAVLTGLRAARRLKPHTSVQRAIYVLGNGSNVTAQDTVPFALWCAAQHLRNYEQALWLTVSGLGDRDTTCAMAGGVVAMAVGVAGIPAAWRAAREALPGWAVPDVDIPPA